MQEPRFLNTLQSLIQNGFSRREEQVGMMHVVHDCYQQKRIGVIEGGTGIGKSFAYLVPLLASRTEEQCVIVATSNTTLQNQLINKDLPYLSINSDLQFTVVMVKGRNRYLCPYRLYDSAEFEQQNLDNFSQAASSEIDSNDEADDIEFDELISAFESGEWNGDRDAYPKVIPKWLWREISTTRHECTGKRCSHYVVCPYYKMRNDMKNANIIVTNHDVLLSDINLGAGKILPKPENAIYVIDEAHAFPRIAVRALKKESSFKGTITWLKKIDKFITDLPGYIQAIKLSPLAEQLSEDLSNAYHIINRNFLSQQDDNERWVIEKLHDDLQDVAKNIENTAREMQQLIISLRKEYVDFISGVISKSELKQLIQMGFFESKLGTLADNWRNLQTEMVLGQAPIARWIRKSESKKSQDYRLVTAPTSAANDLCDKFWHKAKNGIILCSATIRALNSFHHYLRITGLSRLKEDQRLTYVAPSPFDYASSTLSIPKMKTRAGGKNNAAHADEVTNYLPRIIKKDAGTLVIFTSATMLQQAYDALPTNLKHHTLLQKDYSNLQLLTEAHRLYIEKYGFSIIFGLDSCAEGFDLPGELCEHVIITKLKFNTPTDPVMAIKRLYLETHGHNVFHELYMPEASIWFTQAVGRLIRTETDRGNVTVLDTRLTEMGYGKQLLDCLPDFSLKTG